MNLRTIGGGIDVICITKLLDGGVGKITGEKRIAGTRRVPLHAVVFLTPYSG